MAQTRRSILCILTGSESRIPVTPLSCRTAAADSPAGAVHGKPGRSDPALYIMEIMEKQK
jgi:hypothetical protein